MSKYWWKILAVLLLLYVIVVGLGTPLSPGILEVKPTELHAGKNEQVLIQGYNTNFKKGAEKMKVWLECGDAKFCARSFQAKSSDELLATFVLPEKLPDNHIHLYLENPLDGTFVLTDAFWTDDMGKRNGKIPGTCEVSPIGSKTGFTFPFKKILYESIRNLYFHVPMWFGMMGIMLISVIMSIRYLASSKAEHDIMATESVNAGLLLGILGLLTGSVWARFTWGGWWVDDTKLNGAAIVTLMYLAYLILRNAVEEEQKRARIAAVYNIFAFTMLLVFLMILPRMTDSLHPGSGGNPAFSKYDLDSNMRMVFYPAVLGWFLIGLWLMDLRVRMRKLREKLLA